MTPVKEFQNTRFIQSNQHCRVNVSFFFLVIQDIQNVMIIIQYRVIFIQNLIMYD